MIQKLKPAWAWPYSQLVDKINELIEVQNLINKPVTTETKVSTPHLDILTNKCRGDQEITVFDLTEAIFELAGVKGVTNEQPKFTLNQIKFAFLAGRHYNTNYHFDEMLGDPNFINDIKNVWDK